MFIGTDWITEWAKADSFGLRIAGISERIPLRGTWEPNNRIAFAMASFRLAQEHHRAIRLLILHNKSASANALIRPLVEAGLRTIWFIEGATDKQIAAVATGRESAIPLLGELNSLIARHSEKPLSGVFRGLLDSFTHGGVRAMSAQHLEGSDLERANSAITAQASFVLGGAAYSVAQMLELKEIQLELMEATPIID